jgi:CHAT domain-containing protein/tetratricopeptide (TPR) repeat protein
LANRVSHAVDARPTPDGLHAAALLDIALADTTPEAIDRSVTYLRTATLLGDTTAATRVDLSAALLMRGGRHKSVRDVVEALDVSAQAVRIEPRNRAARFDIAVALSELGLADEARQAWSDYLGVDSTSLWTVQASLYLADARRVVHGAENDSLVDAHPSLESLALRDAQHARLVGWDTLLVTWARAALIDNRAEQSRALRVTERLGDAIVDAHGDGSLATAARAIANPTLPAGSVRALARGHLAYAAGQRAYEQGDFAHARGLFERAIQNAKVSPALLAWSRIFHAATLIYLGNSDPGTRELRRVLARIDASKYPALVARSHWMLGTTMLRADRVRAALHEFDLAAGLFEASREGENLGAVRCLIADTKFRVGTRDDYEAMHQALQTLLPYRRSVWLHDLLYTAAKAAAADGYANAALYFQREGITVASSTAEPLSIVEARLSLARLLTALNRPADALREVDASRRDLFVLHSPYAHDWLDADLRLTMAELRPASMSPRDIDPAVRFFSRHKIELRLIPALLARAKLSLGMGREGSATSDLRRAASLIRVAGARIDPGPERDALMESSRGVFDELTRLAVHRGANREALTYQRLSGAWVHPPTPDGRTSARPPGAVLQYALIDDTLYAWVDAQGRVSLERWPIARSTLESDENALFGAVSLAGDDTDLRTLLGRLFDEIVRPVVGALPNDSGPVTVVENGDLISVPFAALWNSATSRYFIQDHILRYSMSGTSEAQRSSAPPSRWTRVALIADPAFDRRLDPELRPLAAARTEVEAVARLYHQPRTLVGQQASSAAVSGLLRWAEIVHYAGHVEYDDGQPEASRLVLAGDAGSQAGEDIRPRDIRSMDLRRARLVVLSSCQALPAGTRRGQGLANLASSFLEAGALGIVAGQWPVNDARTAQLMISFHTFYARSGSAAASLRSAQLAMLHSGSPALSSPATWAGFRYVGQ